MFNTKHSIIFLTVSIIGFSFLWYYYTPPKIRQAPTTFGTHFTDHMFVMEWNKDRGWHNQRIEPYHNFSFPPSSAHMHYGQEIFEGMKAFRTKDNTCVIFRPYDHFERMNQSAHIMSMPEIDPKTVTQWLKKLLIVDKSWIPGDLGTALYLRPTMIATDAHLKLKPSDTYLFFIIMSPVGSYYASGSKPLSLLVEDTLTRATIGVGQAKTGGNYAASMRAHTAALNAGCDQVLWLDSRQHQNIEEAGSMNIFFVYNDGSVVTPALSGSILPGMTRRSIITLGSSWNMSVAERILPIETVLHDIERGKITESFGTGTAAVVTPIGKMIYKNTSYTIGDGTMGPVTKQFFDGLTSIQYGNVPDSFSWLETVA
ncbi:MAG TPA: branched-chain amino acid aminotransferase [Candidatus Bathyarchaeia archaeon]|nr:branched-chain amino acid aminotransferase [Candidatus Bathyarchaeia archaeon]